MPLAGLGIPSTPQLRLGAGDGLGDPLLFHAQGLAPAAEQLPLQGQAGDHVRLAGQGLKLRVEDDIAGAIALGIQPRFAGQGTQVLAAQGLHLGAQRRLVEAQQHLPGTDPVALLDLDPLDDAAALVLHGLAMARDHDLARHRHALVQRRQGGPADEPGKAPQHQDPAQPRILPVVQGQHIAGGRPGDRRRRGCG